MKGPCCFGSSDELETKKKPMPTKVDVQTTQPKARGLESAPAVPKDPIDSAKDPVDSVEDPVNSTENPVNSTEDPVNSTEDPVNSTEVPANSTEDPANSTEDPANSTEDPANSVEDPANSVEDAANSVEDAANSVEDAANSIEDAAKSVEDAANSVEDAANSVEDAENLVEDPVDAVEDPVDAVEDPVDSTEDPVDSIEDSTPEIRERCEELQLSDEQVREIMKRLQENIERGLRRDTHSSSIVKCFVTYVQDLPNGTERGRFMALDLGGTNFRVLLIELGENNHFDMKSKIFAIPEYIMTGPGKQLFTHIADCLATFMKEHNLENECLPLGFTFSFPCTQKGLTKGLLVRWTKGFDCQGVVGNDVVQLLQEAIAERQDIKIDVMAILNDTTGTLMSCAWKKHDCKIGLIVGTGSNACYVEKVENAEMFDGDRSKPHVLINTEWGAFGDDGALDFVRTEYDRDIDENSINAGTQLHEKMVSGMYMGELVRLVLVKMTNDKLLFNGQGSDLLFKRGNFFTKYVSEIESDKKGTYTNCRQVLEELGLEHATDQDCANVRYVCQVVSSRAAHLASAGVATLINRIKEEKVTVGIDGSVYRFHPHFHNLMMEKVAALIEPGLKFDIMLSEDGSGRGAALVAAVASREGHLKAA